MPKTPLTPEKRKEYRERYKAKHGQDGAQQDRERSRAYYHANREERLRKDREKYHTPEGKAKSRAYAAKPEVRERINERKRDAWHTAKGDADKLAERAYYRFLWKTGLTAEMIDDIMTRQNGVCAVCARPFEGSKRHTDHCHDTGLIRGFLCLSCNTIEGRIRASGLSPIDYAQRMHDYLLNPPAAHLKAQWPNKT